MNIHIKNCDNGILFFSVFLSNYLKKKYGKFLNVDLFKFEVLTRKLDPIFQKPFPIFKFLLLLNKMSAKKKYYIEKQYNKCIHSLNKQNFNIDLNYIFIYNKLFNNFNILKTDIMID